MYNKNKIWQKTQLQFFIHGVLWFAVSNVEQSTPLNLAKENPRLKSQSVNSSSAKGKGAIPTRCAGWQRRSVSVTLGCLALSVSPFWAPATTPQTDAINPIDTHHQVKQRNSSVLMNM
jgi:hypothetical protein